MQAIERHRADAALLVPAMIQMLINHPDVRKYDLSSLKSLVYGASPIQEKVLHDLMELLPNLRMRQAYGQTEMGPADLAARARTPFGAGQRSRNAAVVWSPRTLC